MNRPQAQVRTLGKCRQEDRGRKMEAVVPRRPDADGAFEDVAEAATECGAGKGIEPQRRFRLQHEPVASTQKASQHWWSRLGVPDHPVGSAGPSMC